MPLTPTTRDFLPHQAAIFERTKSKEAYGLLWEPGAAKTKPTIETAAHLALKGEILGLLVIAPNGVHSNWVISEFQKDCPAALIDSVFHVYHASKAKTQRHQRSFDRAVEAKGFAVVVATYDIFSTKNPDNRDNIERFLKSRKCLVVLDEAARIKNNDSARTPRVLDLVRDGLAPYRRILSGTPITKAPMDIYSQLLFLDPLFWKKKRIGSYQSFEHRFAVMKTFKKEIPKKGGGTREVRFRKAVAYRDLPALKEMVAELTDRKLKKDVLDLPPKLYSQVRYDLSKKTRRTYDQMKHQLLVQIKGEIITAPMAATKLLRLQQITSGYLPLEDGSYAPIEDDNPRIDLLKEILLDLTQPAIIWARFTQDIVAILKMISSVEELRGKAVRYDGKTSIDDREEALRRMHSGDAWFFVAHPAAAGEGLTLTEAKTVIYYSNSFDLGQRLQSENRAHRPGQDCKVNYIDIIATDTVDEHIVSSLVKKHEMACKITGDDLGDWLKKE